MKIYEAVPNILCVGEAQHISIRQLVASRPLESSDDLRVEIIERRNYRNRETVSARFVADPIGLHRIEFQFRPERKGEYLVHLNLRGLAWPAPTELDIRLFALPRELFQLRPYKGDMHMHTWYSDGDQAPAVMVARCKQHGLDFAAITDHRHWHSSMEAIRAVEQHGFDIVMIPGEECNYCIGLGHILCYGAKECVSDRLLSTSPFKSWTEVDDATKFDALVNWAYPKIENEVKDIELPPGVDRRVFGFYAFIVREIHRSGGVAVAAHPYWVSQRVVDLISPVFEEVLRRRIPDAVELFGSVDFEDNILSLVRIMEERASGNTIPLWTNSDSHDVDFPTFGKQFTVAFSPSRDREALFEAILSGRATGCFRSPGGETIVIGEPFLVQYTYFLLREYFPEQDALARVVGDIYQLKLQGASSVGDEMSALHTEAIQRRERHFSGEHHG